MPDVASRSARSPVRPSEDVVCRQLAGGAVLIDLETNRIFELNHTGARIWALLRRGASMDDITAALTAEYEVGVADAADAAARLVVALQQEGLLGT
ncbi:MAG: PqqD family protein [Vicinamibacterales bacterium]